KSGVVLVSDYGLQIDRMVDVLREVDQTTGGEKVFIIYLQYAAAADIATKINDIYGISKGGAAPGGPPPPGGAPASASSARREGALVPSRIITDERTNSLIVLSSERAYA